MEKGIWTTPRLPPDRWWTGFNKTVFTPTDKDVGVTFGVRCPGRERVVRPLPFHPMEYCSIKPIKSMLINNLHVLVLGHYQFTHNLSAHPASHCEPVCFDWYSAIIHISFNCFSSIVLQRIGLPSVSPLPYPLLQGERMGRIRDSPKVP